MSREIFNHPTIGRVEVRISRQLKRVSIAVMPSGDVRLNIPYAANVKDAIKFLESREEWIAATRVKMAVKVERVKHECQVVFSESTTREELIKMLGDAYDYLPQRTLDIAHANGLVFRELKIGRAMSRWGSCSSENNINLSMFIMGLPPHLRDFIIIHELCHTVHHNHSPKFHELVDKLTGGREKELERELKQWRISMR